MNLRELLKSDFGIDFPITGGYGNSIDNPIIIQKVEPNDFVSIEYAILRCLGEGRALSGSSLNKNSFLTMKNDLIKFLLRSKK